MTGKAAGILAVAALAAALTAGGSRLAPGGGGSAASLRVEPSAFLADVPRIGVNTGTWTAWGASQLSANVLPNPGLEGLLDRALVVVGAAGATRFTDDGDVSGRPDGFWDGAAFDVRSGRLAGRTGRIARSVRRGERGFPAFEPEELLDGLAPGDVVALTKVDDDAFPPGWWAGERSRGRIRPVPEPRPGSGGARSLALDARKGGAVELLSYLDALGAGAGKMLPVRGPWVLSFWVRASERPARLLVGFRRGAQPALVAASLEPGPAWTRVEIPFAGRDDGPAGTLELRFAAEAGRLLLDDVSLSPAGAGTGFREEAAAALARLAPGILRDWQGQLGDTLANRLAPAEARRPSRYRGGDAEAHFHYGIPELLELCRRLGAVPWVVASPAFSDDEWRSLGRYLAGPAGAGFREVLVELGNENWNPTFRPAGIPFPAAHAEVLRRSGRLLAEGAAGAPVRLVANGPAHDPGRAAAYAEGLPKDGLLAVAPYFFYRVRAGAPVAVSLRGLLSPDEAPLAALARAAGGTEVAAAELNLHATFGDAPPPERDPLVTGAAAGTALARRALAVLSLGVRRQCVWSLAGFATPLAEGPGLVRLFGVARDLAGEVRLRPTGLAVALLNRALPGDAHRATGPAPEGVAAVAFRGAAGWSAALVSTREEPVSVELSFPADGALPTEGSVLSSSDPLAGNEEREEVRIGPLASARRGRTVSLRLPPRSVAALLLPGGAS